jgi:hypothetical protein
MYILLIKIEILLINILINKIMMSLRRKYHTEIQPIMMIPGLTYLINFVTIPLQPIEIVFSSWEYLPTNKQMSIGAKIYYHFPNDKNETEYYTIVKQNKCGTFAGHNNLKFYKDYD